MTRERRALFALCCATACAATLAACGGDSGADAAATEQDRETARLRFEKCLRDNGVDVQERRESGPPAAGASASRPRLARVDDTKMRAAMQACAKFRAAAFGTITPEQRQEFRDAFTKFSACMRDRGVDVPAPPGAGGGGTGARPARQRLRITPATEAAMKACQSKLPNGGRPSGGGGGIFIGPGR